MLSTQLFKFMKPMKTTFRTNVNIASSTQARLHLPTVNFFLSNHSRALKQILLPASPEHLRSSNQSQPAALHRQVRSFGCKYSFARFQTHGTRIPITG